MDSLALVKQPAALAILFLALQHISSLPYGGRQSLLSPYGNSFLSYAPFYQQMYNPFPAVPFMQPLQPRPVYVGNPMPAPLPPPRPSMWSHHVYRTLPRVINKPKKKISVFGGPLTNVIPYPQKSPNHLMMKQKKSSRIHSVAKAKTFSGIIKNTALDVGKV